MWFLRLKNWKERKVAKEEIKKAAELMDKWGDELIKLDPSNIKSDRIKAEINRLRGIYNTRTIRLQEDKINTFYFISGILFLGLIFSFFAKPKFNISITLSIIIGLSITLGGVIILFLRHFLTHRDRKAKRELDQAQAAHFRKLVEVEENVKS